MQGPAVGASARQSDRVARERSHPPSARPRTRAGPAACGRDPRIDRAVPRGPAALLNGAERLRRIPLAGRDRQQRGKKRRYGLNLRCAHSEERFQLVEALLRGIVCLEPRRSLQLGDERTKRAVGVVGRALVTQARVRLAGDALAESRKADLPIPGSPEIRTIALHPSRRGVGVPAEN